MLTTKTGSFSDSAPFGLLADGVRGRCAAGRLLARQSMSETNRHHRQPDLIHPLPLRENGVSPTTEELHHGTITNPRIRIPWRQRNSG